MELMTGVFTDNQPDFTWLKPFEEKVFRQYFMPYKGVGQVKNATTEAAVSLSYDGRLAEVKAYATSVRKGAVVKLWAAGQLVLEERADMSPVAVYEAKVPCLRIGQENPAAGAELSETESCPGVREEELRLAVYSAEGECLVEYRPEAPEIPKLPKPARAAKEPAEIQTCEELYLTGQHIEQYRHATYLPDPYYLEGLKRDPGDIRINNAYGLLLMRRGCFERAQKFLEKALERLTEGNPNPYHSETYYLLGLCLLYQGKDDEGYDAFYKATWSSEQQEKGFYYLAAIDARHGRTKRALEHVERSLVKNAHNVKARGLKAYLLRRMGRTQEALAQVQDNLKLDCFDFVSGNERILLEGDEKGEKRQALNSLMRDFAENYLMAARDYAEWGAYGEAVTLLDSCTKEWPMLFYYKAYYLSLKESRKREKNGMQAGNQRAGCVQSEAAGMQPEGTESTIANLLVKAEECRPDYCFPNKPEDISVLYFAIRRGCHAKAPYYLGCLYYDKLQWQESVNLWEMSARTDDAFPTVHRNLALAYYNKRKEPEKAKQELEKAFALNPTDVRIFLELDQLHKKLGWSFEERLADYEAHTELLEERDDLYIEYITLVNLTGNHKKAYDRIMGHKFHPWEGGEGKITTQYTLALLGLAQAALREKDYKKAEELLRGAFAYPENLGEGKLEGTKDNHLYYHLGLALEGQGREEEAKECFENAVLGTDEPAGAMYYNDQPADMILYQGLSYLKLGRVREAKARFYRLIDYGERHLEDQVKIQYFAVSLPEFLIFDEDYTLRNRAHCYYLMALGNMGLGDEGKAAGYLGEAVKIEPSHMMCRVYRSLMADNG